MAHYFLIPLFVVTDVVLTCAHARSTPEGSGFSGVSNEPLLNVRLYGALGDGIHNDTDAFLEAFAVFVREPRLNSRVYAGPGRYLLWPMTLRNYENITFLLEGEMVAASNISSVDHEAFLNLVNVSRFVLEGNGQGVVDGGGLSSQSHTPTSLGRGSRDRLRNDQFSGLDLFRASDGSYVEFYNVSLKGGPAAQLHLLSSAAAAFELTVESAEQAAVGIQLEKRSSAELQQCRISTPNDCVLLDGDTHEVIIQTSIFCTAGIAVQLDSGDVNATVDSLIVDTVTFKRSGRALRVNVVPGASGRIDQITLAEAVMIDVGIPFDVGELIVNEVDWKHGESEGEQRTSGQFVHYTTKPVVTINALSIINVTATQTSGYAGQFYCSDTLQCKSISMENVTVQAGEQEESNVFDCTSAHGTAVAVSPPSCLL